jgi:hypothetical protein
VRPSFDGVRRSVYVHVGAPAAGAKLLRGQLQGNERILGEAGIGLVRGHGREDRSPEGWAGGVLATHHPTVVVSDERLAAFDTAEIERLLGALADHRVHVVYGAVDVGTAIVAEWERHVVSTTREVSLGAWIDELVAGEHSSFWRTYGLRDVATRWAPAGEMHVVLTPPGPDSEHELWARFAAVIGAPLDPVGEIATGADVLSPELLELHRRVRVRLNDGSGAVDARHLALVAAGHEAGWEDRPLLPSRHRAWINQQSSLHRKYLEASGLDIVGDPADLEVDDDRYATTEAAVDDEAVLSAAIQTGAALVERLIADRERRGPVGISSGRRQGLAPVTGPGLVDRAQRALSHTYGWAKGTIRRARLRVVNGDRRTYYLHIGAPKCGSSYLQSLLWRNRDALMRDGVYVPGRSQTDHFHAGTDFRGQPYVTQADDGPWRGAWDRLVDDAERSGFRKIVISSEFLASAESDAIAPRLERLADDDVQLVYAVREFAGLLGSVWQQTVRTSPAAPWPEWLARLAVNSGTDWVWTRHNFTRVLDGWTARGVGRFHVLVLPRPGGPPGELWRRFGSIVGWRARTTIGASRGNESLGYAQAEVLRRLQALLVEVQPREHRARITKNLIGDGTLAPMERVDRLVIPEQLRSWVEAESERQREAIASSSARVVGDLDELLIDESKFSSESVVPDQAAMLDAAVAVVARLARTIVRETP